MTPEFNSDVFEYNCNVQNYIDKIDIEALASDENANIEITGNENLQEGLNEILISVSLNDNEKTVYKINVNKEKKIQLEERKEIDYKTITIIIVAIIIIILIVIFIKKIKVQKNKRHARKH